MRRSTRDRQRPDRFGYSLERFGYSLLDSSCIFSLISNTNEPRTVREAMGMTDADSWIEAMNEEMAALKKNATWDLVHLPKG